MYLNTSTQGLQLYFLSLEYQHEMYLNIILFPTPIFLAILEYQHEMYLNIGFTTRGCFRKCLNINMRCI